MTWLDTGSARLDTCEPGELDEENQDTKDEERLRIARKSESEERESVMDAKSAEKIVGNLENFGGIFSADQLINVKILYLPVSLLVLDNQHWISIYIHKKSLEIMDSAGFTTDECSSKHLLRFLCAHSYGKTVTSTPRLQDENSSDCGKYATTFLCAKTYADISLNSFAKIFSDNYDGNSKIIKDLFNTICKFRS